MSSETRTIKLVGEDQRRYARDVIDRIVVGGQRAWEVIVQPVADPRTLGQNAKFHCLITDIWKQAFRVHGFDGLKAVLVGQFAREMAEHGEPLRHPGSTAWDWKNECPVYVRPSTTKFSRAEAQAFIEWLYAEGVNYDVTFSERSNRIVSEYKELAA
jgi:hypothetical protein